MNTTWTDNELNRIESAEELHIAPQRRDGTLRRPVPIWVVRVGDGLYVRSYRGLEGAWFRAAQTSHTGQISVGGIKKDVTFVAATDSGLNDEIDAAYRHKYRHYPQYVEPMLTYEIRATTLKLVPRTPAV
ncbi:MAG: DUF2255 family protein [Anaerolineae bacterium]|nr:DUF2255 family protein [Anaerolineae bacterium]MCO5191865.1 DUF2255 family protein [Anaerolineae bacterium]